ncbi:hypothetical protein VTK26DRAFT_879 [Humicola hyalothermophila]
MICWACRSAFVADNVPPARRLLLRASPRQSWSVVAASRIPSLLRQPGMTPKRTLPARIRLFSTSTPRPTAPAEAEGAARPASGPEKPGYLSEGESQVWDILVAEFEPTELLVQDISGGCGSMYGIEISSEKFRGLNMLKQQRLVNAALGDLVKQWHGVQLKTRVP